MGKSLVLIRIKVRSAHPAGTAKEEALRQKGFADQDFKISVEYQRKWGFL